MNDRTRAALQDTLRQLSAIAGRQVQSLDALIAEHSDACTRDADLCTAQSVGLAVATATEHLTIAHQLPDINASNGICFYNALADRLVQAGLFSRQDVVELEAEAYAVSALTLMTAYTNIHERRKAEVQAQAELAQILDEHGVAADPPQPPAGEQP